MGVAPGFKLTAEFIKSGDRSFGSWQAACGFHSPQTLAEAHRRLTHAYRSNTVIRKTGTLAATNLFRFSTKYTDEESDLLYYGYRYYNSGTGRWLARDAIEERGGPNLSQFTGNDPIGTFDSLGLSTQTSSFVGKSFINGIGRIGSLGWRVGLPIPPSPLLPPFISGYPWFADLRLRFYARLVGWMLAFNQDPGTDAKDGQYRLYGRVSITADCCGGLLNGVSLDTDQDGGGEAGPIGGTVNLHATTIQTGDNSVTVRWKTWGRPNLAFEPAMQWVAIRTSVNIWHEGVVNVACNGGNPTFTIQSFQGSAYPSRRLWQDGKEKRYFQEASFSALWTSQPGDPTFVAP